MDNFIDQIEMHQEYPGSRAMREAEERAINAEQKIIELEEQLSEKENLIEYAEYAVQKQVETLEKLWENTDGSKKEKINLNELQISLNKLDLDNYLREWDVLSEMSRIVNALEIPTETNIIKEYIEIEKIPENAISDIKEIIIKLNSILH